MFLEAAETSQRLLRFIKLHPEGTLDVEPTSLSVAVASEGARENESDCSSM